MRRKTVPKFYDSEEDLIQCQLCMKWYKALISHIPRIHKITCDQYKEKFGLWNGDLVAVGPRKQLADKQRKNITKARLKAFKKNVVNFPIEKKKKIKERFVLLVKNANFLHTPETKRKMKEGMTKYRKTDKCKEDIKRASITRKHGRYQICECGCKTRFYVPKNRFGTARFFSRKCKERSIDLKNKLKDWWKSDKSKNERKRRSIATQKQWETGKRKGGWHWHKSKLV
jgi:hypothetical protein